MPPYIVTGAEERDDGKVVGCISRNDLGRV